MTTTATSFSKETGQAPTAVRADKPVVRPLAPSLRNLPPAETSTDIELIAGLGDFDLAELGESRAHALGFLSALLREGTHRKAFDATGMCWPHVHIFSVWCPDFGRLYREVVTQLKEMRVMALEDAAFERAVKGTARGIWHEGVKVGEELVPSDKMTELLLRGLNPEKFGRTEDKGGCGPMVTITVSI